jgi:hypothetical protein
VDVHARQQFDFFLNAAIERFIDRVEQRCGGPVPALVQLRADANGEGVWLDEFVAALFADFLLDNAAGAAFVLQALARRPAPPLPVIEGEPVERLLMRLAHVSFGVVLRNKSEEALEQRQAFQVAE